MSRNIEQEAVEGRRRVYVAAARSGFGYLQRDADCASSKTRTAIEGALLRETARRPKANVLWIDGLQKFADVLTTAAASKKVLLRDGLVSL